MRRFVTAVVLLAVVSTGALTSGAAASVGNAKVPFCDAVADLDFNADPNDSNSEEARKIAKGFKKAAKQAKAPKKVLKALKTIGNFYNRIADADSAAAKGAAFARYSAGYLAAFSTFTQHYTTECSSIPTGPSGTGLR